MTGLVPAATLFRMARKVPNKKRLAASGRDKSKEPKRKKAASPRTKHAWRICPVGQHYRSGSFVDDYTTGSGKFVKAHPRSWTCADNPSGKDQLYPEEISKIAEDYFEPFKKAPLKTISAFEEAGNAYDHLIQGWVSYWNEVLAPLDPLDPDVMKALIASESSFNPSAWNKAKGPKRARGLTQVLDGTLPLLKEGASELRDHFLNLSEDDMLDPNLSICAGVRWLLRKKELEEAKLKRPISWREAIIKYKALRPRTIARDRDLIARFDRYLKELKGKK